MINLITLCAIFVMTIIIVLTLILTRKNVTNDKQIEELSKSKLIIETKFNELEKQNIDIKLENTKLNTKLENFQNQNQLLQNKISKYEAEDIEKENQLDRKIRELNSAKDALDNDRNRILKEDEEAKKFELENKNRVWKEHENLVINMMSEVCKKDDLKFELFTNTNFPDNFDTKFKPDTMISFLDQYIIFDAKYSTSQDYDSFLKKQAEDFVTKIENSISKEKIYKTLFLVVPYIDLQNIKKFYYNVNGYYIFITSVFCLYPILSILKKMENYEFVRDFTPEDRETIIDLLASFEQHIRQQNAENIFSTLRGFNVIKKGNSLNRSFKKELDDYKESMKISQVGSASLKNLMNSIDMQTGEINLLINEIKK